MASASASLARVCGSRTRLLLCKGLLLLLSLFFCLSFGQGSLLMHARIHPDRLRWVRLGGLFGDGCRIDEVGIGHGRVGW